MVNDQFLRRVGLLLSDSYDIDSANPDPNKTPEGLDLSEFRISFDTFNGDFESPDNAVIRVHNPSKNTVDKILNNSKYKNVSLKAGYTNGNFGSIFNGEIKQFKTGKLDQVTRYLDILASSGDVFYNQGYFSKSISAGVSTRDQLTQLISQYNSDNGTTLGIDDSAVLSNGLYHSTNIRGKVFFGIARSPLRDLAGGLNLTWTIRNNKVIFSDYRGYKEGEAVVLDSEHGLIGMPEQTEGGIKCRCLLNPKIKIGGLVQLSNDLISKTSFSPNNKEGIAHNKRAPDIIVPLSESGYYRAYIVEHRGDTRGQDWYCDLTLLAVDKDVPVPMATDNV